MAPKAKAPKANAKATPAAAAASGAASGAAASPMTALGADGVPKKQGGWTMVFNVVPEGTVCCLRLPTPEWEKRGGMKEMYRNIEIETWAMVSPELVKKATDGSIPVTDDLMEHFSRCKMTAETASKMEEKAKEYQSVAAKIRRDLKAQGKKAAKATTAVAKRAMKGKKGKGK